MNERLMRAALTRVAEPADVAMALLVHEHGAQGAIGYVGAGALPEGFAARAEAVAAERRASINMTAKLHGWRERLKRVDPARILESFERRGGRLVCPGDPEWPGQLDDLGWDRPYALWVRGCADLRFSCLRSVAMVGSRDASPYGKHVAVELAAALAERGWTIVSGGALGIDTRAHQGALAAGEAPTIAVLACGTDTPYPVENHELFQSITTEGLLVSEWPPGTRVNRLRFLVRNRVIAALTRCTVVVEAAGRSGALNTAGYAMDLHRPLAAVPGQITSRVSAGCHKLIRNGQAVCVTRPEEVLELAGRIGEELPLDIRGPVLPRDSLDPEARRVLEAIPGRGAGPATIAVEAGMDMGTVLRCLGALAAAGFAERVQRGWRPRRQGRTVAA